jgi:hypothetical protein
VTAVTDGREFRLHNRAAPCVHAFRRRGGYNDGFVSQSFGRIVEPVH